jgi:hypothetical protein
MQSRIIIITGINTGTLPFTAKKIKTELIKILSAIGSQNFPKSLIHLYFLAIQPSRKSVKQPMINKIPANKYETQNSKLISSAFPIVKEKLYAFPPNGNAKKQITIIAINKRKIVNKLGMLDFKIFSINYFSLLSSCLTGK